MTTTHFDLPSGIAVLKNGNIVITDGYGNNRVAMFDKTGKFIKQVAKGAGGPADKGTGPGEWVLPHKLAVDAQENMYIIDREGHRLQVYDKNLNYLREIKVEGWNPVGHRHLAQGRRRVRVHRRSRLRAHAQAVVEGRQARRDVGLAGTWARRQFDWVHGVVVDSKGAVYAADTYGQRLQKFVPSGSTSSRYQISVGRA